MRHKIKVPALVMVLGVLGGMLGLGSTPLATPKAQANPGVCVNVPGIVQVGVDCYRGDYNFTSRRGHRDNCDNGRCNDGCNNCGPSQLRFEAYWDYEYKGGNAFPWETGTRFGCVWVVPIPDQHLYYLELREEVGKPDPQIDWVRR